MVTATTPVRTVSHGTFTVERTYPVPPARVFAAWASKKAKARWFAGAAQDPAYENDFRIGGREYSSGEAPGGGVTFTYEAHYQDIVPDTRIIYSYVMHINGNRTSVSIGTVDLKAAGKGTRLVYTEQGAFLDGFDNPAEREEGTRQLLDALGKELAG